MTPPLPSARMTTWLEQAWLIRYLDRELSEDESTWFEAYLLDKPDLLMTIDADNRLRSSLLAEPAQLRASASEKKESNRQREQDGDDRLSRAAEAPRQQHRGTNWLAIAAALVLGASVAIIGTRTLQTSSQGLIANPMRIVYDTMRGGETPSTHIEHKDSLSPYVLVEVAVPPDAKQISMKFGDAAERPLEPSADGFVSFLIDRNQLKKERKLTVRFHSAGATQSRELTVQD